MKMLNTILLPHNNAEDIRGIEVMTTENHDRLLQAVLPALPAAGIALLK